MDDYGPMLYDAISRILAGEMTMQLLAHVTVNEVGFILAVFVFGLVCGIAAARTMWSS